jgi:hypothetical protein
MTNQDSTGRLPKRIGGSNTLISLSDTAERLDVPTSTLYKNWRAWASRPTGSAGR